jgi:hypothetical protein
MRRISVLSVISALVAVLVWLAISYATRDPNRGFDTTCGDFLGMTNAQQVAVMKKAGVLKGHYEERASYYRDGCRQDAADRRHPIGDIMG